jgi:hypothetical protein
MPFYLLLTKSPGHRVIHHCDYKRRLLDSHFGDYHVVMVNPVSIRFRRAEVL